MTKTTNTLITRKSPLSIYSSVIIMAINMGVDIKAECSKLGIPSELIKDSDAFITANQFHSVASFFRSLFENDPAFCLNIANLISIEMADKIGVFFSTTPSINAFIDDCKLCQPLLDPCINFYTLRLKDEVECRIDVFDQFRNDPGFYHAEAALAFFASSLKRIFQIDNFPPLKIHVEHDGEQWRHIYQDHFGGSSEFFFLSDRNSISIPNYLLEKTNPNGNSFIHSHFKNGIDLLLKKATRQSGIATQVFNIFIGHQDINRFELSYITQTLRMNERSLQRSLSDEGFSFRELRDLARFEITKKRIASGETDFDIIAYELGFSERTSLSRAFKKWAGKSLSDYRRSIM